MRQYHVKSKKRSQVPTHYGRMRAAAEGGNLSPLSGSSPLNKYGSEVTGLKRPSKDANQDILDLLEQDGGATDQSSTTLAPNKNRFRTDLYAKESRIDQS